MRWNTLSWDLDCSVSADEWLGVLGPCALGALVDKAGDPIALDERDVPETCAAADPAYTTKGVVLTSEVHHEARIKIMVMDTAIRNQARFQGEGRREAPRGRGRAVLNIKHAALDRRAGDEAGTRVLQGMGSRHAHGRPRCASPLVSRSRSSARVRALLSVLLPDCADCPGSWADCPKPVDTTELGGSHRSHVHAFGQAPELPQLASTAHSLRAASWESLAAWAACATVKAS